MPYTSEIDKLEQRFAENRRGRTFAPLADAYRKAGLIDNAVELCQEGLKIHPDYVSAWIVYGRCLLDKKDDTAAQDIYEKVLGLDPENVLALRTLAEIAERGNRPDVAAGWLNRLLAADPMNGDAAEALARVKGKASVAQAAAPSASDPSAGGGIPVSRAPASPAPVTPEADTTLPPPRRPSAPSFEIERASGETTEVVPEISQPAEGLETADAGLAFNEDAHLAAKAEGLEVQEEVILTPERIEVEGLARTQYEGSGMFQLDHLPGPPPSAEPVDEALDLDESSPPIDLPLIMPEELDAAAAARAFAPPPPPAPPTPPAPPAPPPPRSPAMSFPSEPMRVSAPHSPPPPPHVPAPPSVSVRLADDDGAADRSALSQVEPVVTETMAELYLRQGHKEDALRVYQALLAQRPNDGRLRSRIDALSGRQQGSGQTAGAFLKSIFRAGSTPAPPTDAHVSALVRGAFEHTLDEPLAAPGEPTKPADDTISLDSVFGEPRAETNAGGEGYGEGEADAAPMDGGGRGGRGGSAAPRDDGGTAGHGDGGGNFSFDEFFNSSMNSPGAQTPRPARPSRPPTDDPSEVDQFQAWLKKLKS